MGLRNSARELEFYSSFRDRAQVAAKLAHSVLLYQDDHHEGLRFLK